MKTYKVIITTTFVREIQIQAKTAAEAQSIAEESLDAALDCEPDTSIEVTE